MINYILSLKTYPNIARLWQWETATNHYTDLHVVTLICLMSSVFIFITLDGVTSFLFSRMKTLRNTCERLYHIQSSWRDTLSCNGGKLAISDGNTLPFRHFFCKNRNFVLLTSDLLPNISLVVGQSSVNISLS